MAPRQAKRVVAPLVSPVAMPLVSPVAMPPESSLASLPISRLDSRPLSVSTLLALPSLLFFSLLMAAPARADGVEAYLYDFAQQQKTDPQGFYLMIGCVCLIAFLALTIFGGFLYYLFQTYKNEPRG